MHRAHDLPTAKLEKYIVNEKHIVNKLGTPTVEISLLEYRHFEATNTSLLPPAGATVMNSIPTGGM